MSDEQLERMRQTMDLAFRAPAALTIVASDSTLTFTSDSGSPLVLYGDGRKFKQSVEGGGDIDGNPALALAEFTLCERVPFMLGSLALDVTEPLDLRYSAFTSLERVGPTPESIDILRQLSADETLGRSARSLLSSWKVA